MELVDESVQDLLGGPGCRIEEDPWEGPKVSSAVEYQLKSLGQFKEKFSDAK